MRTQLARDMGLEFPIFAFSHCRDVVAAVSRAGGMGVLGALYFTPEELEIELKWIDEHVDGKPYGVDLVMPAKVQLPEGVNADELEGQLEEMISREHRDWVEKVLSEHGVPPLPESEGGHHLLGWTDATARPQIDIAFQHSPSLLVNALGPPPADIVDAAHGAGSRSRRWPVARGTRRSTSTSASTSWWPRAPRPAGTRARSARWCCGRR